MPCFNLLYMDPPPSKLAIIFVFCAGIHLCAVSPAAAASWFNLYDQSYRSPAAAAGNESELAGIELPPQLGFISVSTSADSSCHQLRVADHRVDDGGGGWESRTLKLNLKPRQAYSPQENRNKKEVIYDSAGRDFARLQTMYRRIVENKNSKTPPVAAAPAPAEVAAPPELAGRLVATLESGVTLGSGEYFIDVFIGTPPRHFSLILDTGSDLNWIQCVPCIDCFDQRGPYYDPAASSTYRNVTCADRRCNLVASADGGAPPRQCKSPDQPCDYFYWYGDRSNTTGDLAVETFTVNLTAGATDTAANKVDGVVFGCGHWNRGLFHGAAGLLGLGRGPLSFSSQLKSLYGHTFSYCLVDRNSDLSVSSKLIFGEDKSLLSHPHLNFTSFVHYDNGNNQLDTFYYVKIKSIIVGGEALNIPAETWELSNNTGAGTIIDSGTTLSYFADPAYKMIQEAFAKKVKNYPIIDDLPPLDPCYNVSGVKELQLPEFAIEFADGAVWNFPVENYFIRLEPEEIVCLAILGTPRSSLSIIGNYQQQNFQVLYDNKNSRLGFAPMKCSQL